LGHLREYTLLTPNSQRNTSRLKSIFLDRDGVINEDRADYVKNVSELRIFSCAPPAIRRLNDAGYQVIVVSNQQGVAKGIVSWEDLRRLQDEIDRSLDEVGARIAAYYYCTHSADEGCLCRKPKPGMLTQAASEHDIDLGSTFMIGDAERDLIAGSEAGCRTILVLSGHTRRNEVDNLICKPDFVADDLAMAVDYLLSEVLRTAR